MMVGQWVEIALHMFAGQGEERLPLKGAPIICAVHDARYLISATALLGSDPHFYTSEHSERFSHLPKVTY